MLFAFPTSACPTSASQPSYISTNRPIDFVPELIQFKWTDQNQLRMIITVPLTACAASASESNSYISSRTGSSGNRQSNLPPVDGWTFEMPVNERSMSDARIKQAIDQIELAGRKRRSTYAPDIEVFIPKMNVYYY